MRRLAGQKEPVSRNCGLTSGNRMEQLSRNLIYSGIFAIKTQILICNFVAGLKKRDRSCLFNSCGFDQTLKRKPDMRKQVPGLRSTHIYTQVKHLFSFIIVSSAFEGTQMRKSSPAAVPGGFQVLYCCFQEHTVVKRSSLPLFLLSCILLLSF